MKIKKLGLFFALLGICFLVGVPSVYADEDDDTTTVSANSKDAIGNMLLQSVSLIGIPYRWGGNTPQTGMDCSGFIRYVFQKSLGITLPRTAAGMSQVGIKVGLDDLEPGDLLFFHTDRGSRRISHVGMYIGNGQFIQSPHTGATIQITPFTSAWRAKTIGAKRIVQENEDDNGKTVVESFQDITDQGLPNARGHTVRGRHGKRSRRKTTHRVTKKQIKKLVKKKTTTARH